MSDRVRLAVAGLGAIAQSVHLPLIARRWDLFELVAVCDLAPSLRADVGEQYGVPEDRRYADAGRMVEESGADGVVLLTSGSHGDVALRALRAGVAVFCEKPLTYTVAEADALAAAEEELGRPGLLLAYMKEHDEAVWQLGERLAGIDDVRAVEVEVLHPTGQSQLAYANLRPAPLDVDPDAVSRLAVESGRLLDAAIGAGTSDRLRHLYANVVLGSIVHNTSLLRAVFGGLVSVDGARQWPDGAQPGRGPGSVEVTGELPGAVRARMSWHYLPDYPAYTETLTVHHGRGSLRVTFGTPYVLNNPTRLEVVEAPPAGMAAGGEVRSVFTSTGESFENELADFHRMVTAGEPPRAGVAEGRADILTSQRIVRLLAGDEPVSGEAARA
ncbi:Gfo/Idh/MocA family oxidoreductase [Jiangella aurantiaca]|uniref:Gfo/Idh/MocA family oxidoreductase n=1 Tax=Jiangella aurantiaca TaxID=2530373 RepID=A0A4V2YSN2_9ACTN|nr:Gfo/Idh/MocA family oxidoreductase [Jiangella aurantiaca]TDD70687.1 Gfo/Idh/MocA family oxidoreductase [Jiangella aurantiaca]